MRERLTKLTLPAGRWYGETLLAREVATLKLAENRYSAGYRTRRHAHESLLFNLILEGSLTQQHNGKLHECGPMSLISLAPHEVHSEVFHAKAARVFILEISPTWAQKNLTEPQLHSRTLVFEGGVIPWLMLRIFREFEVPDMCSALCIEGLAMELIAAAWRAEAYSVGRKPPAWLTTARELIHDRFKETLSVAEIAREVDIHPIHLARTFHRYYGCTVGEYLRQRRIEFASIQMMTSSAPLCEIAQEAGFYDQSHFTHVFKRITGLPPNVFRAACARR